MMTNPYAGDILPAESSFLAAVCEGQSAISIDLGLRTVCTLTDPGVWYVFCGITS